MAPLLDPMQLWTLAGVAAGLVVLLVAVRQVRVRLRRDRALRLDAQRAAAHHARLAELTGALGRARTERAVIETAVQEPLHALHADAALFLTVAEDQREAVITRAVAYDAGSGISESAGIHLDGPDEDAARLRTPVLIESRVAVPLLAAGRVAAIVRIDFRAPRAFTDDDREYFGALGRYAAPTLERARQYEAAEHARAEAEELRARAAQELEQRQKTELALRSSETRYRALATRTTRLHALTAALSGAGTVDAVARAVVEQGNVVVGATSGSVSLLDREGHTFAVLHAESHGRADNEREPLPAEPGTCEADALRAGRPIFVASWDEARERHWRSAADAADAAYASSAVLPLAVDDRPIGVLRFDFSVPVNFDAEYRALLISVAQHCTQALDRARLYEEAQRARAAAEDANRHKDEFLSIVSHELRTPLNAVLGWAAVLRRATPDPALSLRAAQSIHDNASRQARLIDDLLDVSRIVAGRATLDLREIDLAELVAGVVESLTPVAAEARISLVLAPLPHACVRADARRLEQVFFNLLSNSVKFTDEGGRIEIAAEIVDSQVDVRVRDSGIGIEPSFLPFVFEPFRQADGSATRSYGGLGLGLSIAKQLVDAHKGTLSVDSAGRGQGTTLTVRLPIVGVAPPARPARVAERRDEAPPRLDGVRVLAVDDDAAARDIVDYALRERGAEVTVAASGAEAFALLMRSEFDVLLADIAMPDEDGCALLSRIRASAAPRAAQIPAAAVTAHARDDERRAVLAAGFQLHLIKPIEPSALARAVDQLARSGPMSAA